MVALEQDQVALVDHARRRHRTAVAVRHHVDLHGVVGHVRRADHRDGALEQRPVERARQHLAAVALAHLPLELGADPVRPRERELHALLLGVGAELDVLEVVGVGRARHDAHAGGAGEAAGARLEHERRRCRVRRDRQAAARVDRHAVGQLARPGHRLGARARPAAVRRRPA